MALADQVIEVPARRYPEAMSCTWVAACVVLCGCAGSIVRAPKQIPSDGVVECTDSMETPLESLAVGVVSTSVAVAAPAADPQGTVDSGGIMWVPVLGILGVDALIAAAEGAASVLECREAKQRGAEIAEAARRKAEARAEAETQWKRAYAAARADDCATVRALDPQVRALDVEFHDVVFMRDVGITRCLVGAR